MSSGICFNLDLSKILWSGNGLKWMVAGKKCDEQDAFVKHQCQRNGQTKTVTLIFDLDR